MQNSDYSIGTDLSLINLDRVHHWLSTDAYWALGRSRDTVQRAAEASLNFGAFDGSGQLVGYARVVTDQATFAWLCDVYVDPSARGHGVGQQLAETVVSTLHPMGLQRVLLGTADAHWLYEKVGFTPYPNPQNLMVLTPPAE